MPRVSTTLRALRGLDTETDPFEKGSAFGTSVLNVTFSRRRGAIQQCYGYSTLGISSPSGNAEILGWHTYVPVGGGTYQMVRTKMGYYVRQPGCTKWSALLTFGSSTPWAIPTFVDFYDRVWFCDGIGIWSWNGFSSPRPHVGSTAGKRNWPPWGTQFLVKHFERLWAAGYWGNPGRIVYSEVGATSPSTARNTVTFSVSRTFNIDRQKPDDGITGLLPQFGQVSNLLVFKRKSVWTIAGNDQATFDIDMLSFDAGCVGSRAAVNTPDGAYWLDKEKLIRFNGVDALTSVSGPIARLLNNRVKENVGYRPYVYFNHGLDTLDGTRLVYNNAAAWSANTISGHTGLLVDGVWATSAFVGIKASVPCNSYRATFHARLPKVSTYRWFAFLRAANNVSTLTKPAYVLSFGNSTITLYGTSFAGQTYTLAFFSAAAANAVKLASVGFGANRTEWASVVAYMDDNRIASLLKFSGTSSRYMEYRHTAAAALLNPRSTMYFGLGVAQSVAMGASGAMFDQLSISFYRCNTYSQLGWSKMDNTVHVATASTDSAPDGMVLVYEVDPKQWTMRSYNPRCYNSAYVDGNGRTWLGVQTEGNVAANGKFYFFNSTLNYSTGKVTNCLYRTNWLQGPTADLEQWLTELHVQHERKAGRNMLVFISGRNGPWGDAGPTKYLSFPMTDPHIRVAFDIPSQYTRITFATNTASADSFDLSRVRLMYDVNTAPAWWRER